ncbi:helix-turn-helix domain-containing protein [Brochothrix thermosphacta]|uniref:helix-turn-helix domain-containing protein n=1 Tax=Brochothrix thermosphacta TaxID=2756 RepID=UPI0027139EE2|nr:helix-turn-helix domain-containing protein [Brochothrix thermosphacta]MDO7864771.1 helix-turn-helix domain-containing protein [Brochothrix thermosphacta]
MVKHESKHIYTKPNGEKEIITLSVKEVSHILGKHPNTIYTWIQQGLIPVIDINGRKYIPKKEFERKFFIK